jgi:uncharacterized membrane protein
MTDRSEHQVVRALPVNAAYGHRLARVMERVRDRFWSIPIVLIVAAMVTAAVVSRPDLFGLPDDWRLGHVVRTSTADAMLQVMASSMLTFVGIVFAITLVGLQLASSQVSPRVIRTFARSWVTKTAFGVFLATFAFAITAIAFDDTTDPRTAGRTAGMAVLMLAVAVVVFVVYVTATLRLLEVGWVITAVANEARAAIEHGYPEQGSYVDAAMPTLEDDPALVRLPVRGRRNYRGELGTVLGIDRPRLVALASRYDCVVELVARIGEYIPTGGPAFAIHGRRRPSDSEILACLDLGRARTLYQDPTFGVRQLVDVATQALSPAINQPTTAVQVIDRIHDLLLRIARRPEPTGFHVDSAGIVRLVEPTTSWRYVLHLSFDEIIQYGADSRHVTRRLAAAYADLEDEVPTPLLDDVVEVRNSLVELVRKRDGAADLATAPDRLGLG